MTVSINSILERLLKAPVLPREERKSIHKTYGFSMKYLSFIFCFISSIVFAQYNPDAKRDYNWVFGRGELPHNLYGAGILDFNSNPPDTSSLDHEIDMYGTNCSMSDTTGQLMFFSNGMFVADRTGHIMPHGDSLNFGAQYLKELNTPRGYAIEQGILSLQLPGNDSLYYLIHEKCEISDNPQVYGDYLFFNLAYSVVNMHRNGGLGDVVQKNQIIIADTFNCGRITATRHGNGRDWWILVPEHNSNAFYKILLNPEGFHVMERQFIGDTNQPPYGYGQAAFSPNGKLYARIQSLNLNVINSHFKIGLFSFDRCIGHLDQYINLSFTDTIPFQFAIGLAFSPNSRFLYVIGTETVYQFDLEASDIPSSKIVVATYDGFTYFYNPASFCYAQIGPDNKIYISAWVAPFLHVISNPDSAGIACNVQQHVLRLPYKLALLSMPNNPNYRLGRWLGSPCDVLWNGNEQFKDDEKTSIRAVPNPAKDIINFELDIRNNAKPIKLEIYSALSEKIGELRIGPYQGLVQYNVSQLTNGIYFAKLSNESQIITTTKFVVNR